MAEVYKAYQPRLERYVAIKFIRPELAATADFLVRFEQEAKLLARLSHPYIIHIYDFGETDGPLAEAPAGERRSQYYLAMQYVAGGTLKEWLSSLRIAGQIMPLEQALLILQQVSSALDYAHQQGIIHRDIKPANIILTPERQALLNDFGIAKILGKQGDLTEEGSTSGTPAYMSPEQIEGDTTRMGPPSDLYSLGVVLYEMVAGQPPFLADSPLLIILKHLKEEPAPPRTLNPDLPEALERVILKALAKDPADRHQTAGELAHAFQEALLSAYPQTADLTATVRRGMWWPLLGDEAPAPGEPPFKGLQYFNTEDADLFFGRELLTAKLVARLREKAAAPGSEGPAAPLVGGRRFLAVIGASGSGKSSLVRAGLIPALRRQEPLADGAPPPEGSAEWPVHVITPTAQPLESLAASLTREETSVAATATLIDDLTRDPRSLHLYARRLLAQAGSSPATQPAHLLLVVDQFEELFTLCRNETERQAFVDNLLVAVEMDGPVVLVITLRADFYAHCAQFAQLRELLSRQQEYIGPMSPEELRRAMEEPARKGGWTFEPGLVELLLREVGTEPGALPLLSHALLETWRHRRGRTLTFGGYSESGGVRGAIARTAETVYQELTPEQQSIARSIFLRLTELGEGTQDTRRRATLTELVPRPEDAPAVETVLKTLTDARLITTGEGTAEVAHEALIREWPRLQNWLDENREGLHLHRHLTEAAQAWEKLNRDLGELYRGARLAQASEWAETHAAELNSLEREFLTASEELARRRETEREEAQQRQVQLAAEQRTAGRLRRLAAGLLIVTLLAAGLGAAAWWQRNLALTAQAETQQQRDQAELARQEAQTQRDQAEAAQIEAEAARKEADSLKLAFASQSQLGINYELALLLAIEAGQANPTSSAANTALRSAFLHPGRSLKILGGHKGQVTSANWNEDGTRILTTGEDGTARVWDAESGAELLVLEGHTDQISAAAWNGAGIQIVTASDDGTARVWDAATGTSLAELAGHGDKVKLAAWDPTDSHIVTISDDGTARIWEAETGKELAVLEGHEGPLTHAAWDAEGKRIVTAGEEGTARLWDAASGEELFVLEGHEDTVTFAAWNPAATRVVTTGEDGTARVWDPATGAELTSFTGHSGDVRYAAWDPSGERLATTSEDGSARVWDPETGAELVVLAGHIAVVSQAAWNKAGTRIVTVSEDGTARVWDPEKGAEVAAFREHTAVLRDAAWDSTGSRIVTVSDDSTTRVWEAETGQELAVLEGHEDIVRHAAWSPDDTRIATTSEDNTARIWDAVSGAELAVLEGHEELVSQVEWNPAGTRLVTASEDNTARIWDAQSGDELFVLKSHERRVRRVAWSPDGTRIATASLDNTARIWDAETGAELFVLEGHEGAVRHVAWNPSGTRLVTVSADGTARLWDTETGADLLVLDHLPDNSDALRYAVWSPDGAQIVTGGDDRTARVWDAKSGEQLFILAGHTAAVDRLTFSPDGQLLATASDDGTARLWDSKTGTEVAVLTGHTNQVQNVVWNRAGTRLVAVSDDSVALVYYVQVEDLLAAACERALRNLTESEWQRYLGHTPYHKTCPNLPASSDLASN